MNFKEILWADMRIENINIEYDHLSLIIVDDLEKCQFCVKCHGFVGITDLCMWDDTIIFKTDIRHPGVSDNEYLKKVYKSYDKDFDYGGGRILGDNLLELMITLSNNLTFSIYCQGIEVSEYVG